MWDAVEVFRQISVHHVGVAVAQKLMHFPDRVLRAPLRSITIGIRIKVRLEDRLQHQFGGSLHYSVPYGRYPERPFTAPRLRNHNPSHWLWLIRLRAKFLPNASQPLRQPLRLDSTERAA